MRVIKIGLLRRYRGQIIGVLSLFAVVAYAPSTTFFDASEPIARETDDLTLRRLPLERAYVLQTWADRRGDGLDSNNTRWMTDGLAAATSVSQAQLGAIKMDVPFTLGGTGELCIAAFTAAGIAHDLDRACSKAALPTFVRAGDVRCDWSGRTTGEWSSTATHFGGGMALHNKQITHGGSVAFTHLGLIGGQEVYDGGSGTSSRTLVLNRNISVPSTGVSIGRVRFEKHKDPSVDGATTVEFHGTQTTGRRIACDSTSIFEWDLTTSTGGGRGTDRDTVYLSTGGGPTVDPAATFRLVLASDIDFGDDFWETTRTWDMFDAASSANITSAVQDF